jgi:hypothetical protein
MMSQDHGMVSVESAVGIRGGEMEEGCRVVASYEPDAQGRWISEPPR